MKIIDVSLSISHTTPTYPGDPEPMIKRVFDIDKGDAANVSKIALSSHVATHIDAPLHFLKDGVSVDELPLETFIGRVKVFEMLEEDVITRALLEKKNIEYGDRIFLKTKNSEYLKQDEFYKDFVFLSPDAALYLVDKCVRIVGIDYLSIEKYNSEDYAVHKILLKNNIIIVEGLDLKDVDEGEYKYVCLPLKIKNCDGAPARVILIEE